MLRILAALLIVSTTAVGQAPQGEIREFTGIVKMFKPGFGLAYERLVLDVAGTEEHFIFLKYNDNKLEVEISNPVKDQITDAPSLTREFKKSRDLSTGLGMGLWICEQILKLHDGSLTLNSQDLIFKATVALPGNCPRNIKFIHP